MSFWKKMLGLSNDKKEIMEQPEHELAKAPDDDLMVVDKDNVNESSLEQKQEESASKDSP